MICPKIKRTVVSGPTQQAEEQIVTGISDYIPLSLRSQQNINISIIGNQTQIVNQILWNEFFAKSLIKEAYYFLMHSYASEGRMTTSAVFAKRQGKVYKMDEVMEWKSALREVLLKQDSEVATLELQGFSNKGNIRKINIYLSRYPVSIDKLHLVLKTESIEVAKISRNEFVSESATDEYRLLEETDRTNKYHQENAVSNLTHKTKFSQISNISLKTKQSQQSKENYKQSKASSKVSSKKGEKKANRQKSFQTNRDAASRSEFEHKNTVTSLPQQPNPINRESVLAKIITSKEEQIIFLKQELQDKTYQYEIAVREQEESHKKQVQHLTKSVKEVLQSYSCSQKQAQNENMYLKERVKILQEAIEKTNGKLESYTQQMEDYVTHVRQLQQVNNRLSATNKKLVEEQDRNRNSQLCEVNRMNCEVAAWKQKAEDYRIKYEKIVDMMKNVINFT